MPLKKAILNYPVSMAVDIEFRVPDCDEPSWHVRLFWSFSVHTGKNCAALRLWRPRRHTSWFSGWQDDAWWHEWDVIPKEEYQFSLWKLYVVLPFLEDTAKFNFSCRGQRRRLSHGGHGAAYRCLPLQA